MRGTLLTFVTTLDSADNNNQSMATPTRNWEFHFAAGTWSCSDRTKIAALKNVDYVAMGEYSDKQNPDNVHFRGVVQFIMPLNLLEVVRVSYVARWSPLVRPIEEHLGYVDGVVTKNISKIGKLIVDSTVVEQHAQYFEFIREARLPDARYSHLVYRCSEFMARYPKFVDDVLALYRVDKVMPLKGRFDNKWIFGPSLSGKTEMVENEYPKHFKFDNEKFFEGYQMEDTVVIDDFGPGNRPWFKHLIEWTGRKIFMAIDRNNRNIKNIRPRRFIVTSYYDIREVSIQEGVSPDSIKTRILVNQFETIARERDPKRRKKLGEGTNLTSRS